ncbi:IS1634 family transposase [Funiculus sociatus GB2-M2]|uniref:IS1634 family transposase n=1 Tax=Cyanophyceae TaxID=3028117 RepID=UPI001F554D20|nr:IS1634 family transposase [Trichocoleus sp. FACHB-90]
MKRTSSERVDDVPVVIKWLSQMQIEALINQEVPPPHGNRQGLSYGQLAVLLLSYTITQADHRLCAVETWVKQHHQTLELATGWKIADKDATDDRLADLLSVLGGSEHQAREAIETFLGQHLIRAYELPTQVARSDTTSFSVYHQANQEVSEPDQASAPLLNFGYSKDRRPDLLQYRQMLATLDPLGVPLLSATLEGNGADDPTYVPTWKRLAQIIGHHDFLFLADCKASSWSNRGQIDREQGIYCFPVGMSGHRPQLLRDWVLNPPTPITDIWLPNQEKSETAIGEGFEVPLGSLWLDPDTRQWHRWSERWLVIRSHALAQRQIKGLEQRLQKAEKALVSLAAKPGQDAKILQEKVEQILQRHRVEEHLLVTVNKKIQYPKVYESVGRPSLERPFRRVRKTTLTLSYQRLETAIALFTTLAGWRLYVTNAPAERLSLEQAVFYYREQWQPERGFHRFKRGRLPALPIYFQDENRIQGLMFLLTIALRVFTLMEFVVRRQLQEQQTALAGLYDGNPRRATVRPTAERLLAAFCGITLYFHPDESWEISPLNPLQTQILQLMGIDQSIYSLPERCNSTKPVPL